MVARDLGTEPQDGAYRDANTLYYATVAQYPRCTALVGAPDCRSGLPVPVVTALGKAAALVAADGPKVAPYEFCLPRPAVDACGRVSPHWMLNFLPLPRRSGYLGRSPHDAGRQVRHDGSECHDRTRD